MISREVSNLSVGDLSFPAHAKPRQLLLQTVLCSFFCNFNCHGFKAFLTRLLLLKWEVFESQAVSVKNMLRDFLTSLGNKRERKDRLFCVIC